MGTGKLHIHLDICSSDGLLGLGSMGLGRLPGRHTERYRRKEVKGIP